jgi:hypothetical protein
MVCVTCSLRDDVPAGRCKTKVVKTRTEGLSVRRWRRCGNCGELMITTERVERRKARTVPDVADAASHFEPKNDPPSRDLFPAPSPRPEPPPRPAPAAKPRAVRPFSHRVVDSKFKIDGNDRGTW